MPAPAFLPTGSAPALAARAEEAYARREWEHAFDLMAQAVRAAPGNLEWRVRHAVMLGQCGRFASARRLFDQMLRAAAAGHQPFMRGVIGVEWHKMGRDDLAEPMLATCLTHPDMPAHVHAAMANALERLNKVEQSMAIARDGLRRFQRHHGLTLALARALARRGDLVGAKEHLHSLLASNPPAKVAIEAGYALGHALEADGRHDDAYAAFVGAKNLQRPLAAAWMGPWRRQMDKLSNAATFPDAEDFRRWKEMPPGKTPDMPARLALLTGCPRSGTTLFERVLAAHSDVLPIPEVPALYGGAWLPLVRKHAGAPHAAAVLRQATAAQLVQARGAYAGAMAEAADEPLGDRLLLDKNPSLLGSLPVACRLLPEARLLVAIRDPRAIVWSCFTRHLPMNTESAAFLDLGTCARHVGVLLEYWMQLRGRLAAPWLEIRYEDAVRDLPGQARRATDFLGLPWQPQVLDFHRQPSAVRSPSYAQASLPVYGHATDNWRHHGQSMEPHMGPLKTALGGLGYA